MERAHKLHPREAGPFLICRLINPNAYDVAIPSDWGISSTFNICDILAYQGPLDVPSEPGLPPNSMESSLFALEENDGDPLLVDDTTADDEGNPSPGEGTTANGPEPMTEPDTYAGTTTETEQAKEKNRRPHRSAKPMTKAKDYFYF